MRSSNLYKHVCTVGQVIDKNGFCVTQLGSEYFIVASLLNYFIVYDLHKLRICYRSPVIPFRIKHIYAYRESVYTLVKGKVIIKWLRNEVVGIYKGHQCTPIGMFLLGRKLISYSNKEVFIWLEEERLEVIEAQKDEETCTKLNNANQSAKSTNLSESYYYDLNGLANAEVAKHPDLSGDLGSVEKLRTYYECLYMPEDIEISYAIHPDTYLNKIVIFTTLGEVLIYNIASKRFIYKLKCLKSKIISVKQGRMFKSSCLVESITCACTTVCSTDVIAIGNEAGSVYVVDIKKDVLLMRFEHDKKQGRVHSLTFYEFSADSALCSYDLRKPPAVTAGGAPDVFNDNAEFPVAEYTDKKINNMQSMLVAGMQNGDMCLWNLQSQTLHNILPKVHSSCVNKLQNVPTQPLMISSGMDNKIILWIFDSPDGRPRILKKREGLPNKIHHLQFYDESSMDLLASSELDGRCFLARISAIQQQRNTVLSQKNLLKIKDIQSRFKMNALPSLIGLAFCANRHFDWPNVVTIHRNTHIAFIWSFHNNCLSKTILKLSKEMKHPHATAVAISQCGNYVAVGYGDGQIHRYNLQSGLHRGSYEHVVPENKKVKAHLGNVCSLITMNSQYFISASSRYDDKRILMWNWTSHKLENVFEIKEKDMESVDGAHSNVYISLLKMNANSYVCAVVLNEYKVYICDILTKHIIHKINLENNVITDVCFSNDSKWLVVCTSDGCMYTFDILSSILIDWVRFKFPVISVIFHPSDNFLYTSHSNPEGGIKIWTNKHIFDCQLITPILRGVPKFAIEIDKEEESFFNFLKYFQNNNEEGFVSDYDISAPENQDNNCETNILQEGKYLYGYAEGVKDKKNISSKYPLSEGVFTLSGLHFNKLQSMINWEFIKEKNKPVKAVEHEAEAPFFLPSLFNEASSKFAKLNDNDLYNQNHDMENFKKEMPHVGKDGDKTEKQAIKKSRIIKRKEFMSELFNNNYLSQPESNNNNNKRLKNFSGLSILQELLLAPDSCPNISENGLLNCEQNQDNNKYKQILQYLSSLAPAGVHLALSELGAFGAGNKDEEIYEMLRFFDYYVGKRDQVDFIQTLLLIFTRMHGEYLDSCDLNEKSVELLKKLKENICEDAAQLDSVTQKLLCFLKVYTQLQM